MLQIASNLRWLVRPARASQGFGRCTEASNRPLPTLLQQQNCCMSRSKYSTRRADNDLHYSSADHLIDMTRGCAVSVNSTDPTPVCRKHDLGYMQTIRLPPGNIYPPPEKCREFIKWESMMCSRREKIASARSPNRPPPPPPVRNAILPAAPNVVTPLPQMLREMQDEQRAINTNPAEMQAQAHASAVKRFTGGGFAVS